MLKLTINYVSCIKKTYFFYSDSQPLMLQQAIGSAGSFTGDVVYMQFKM